MNNRKGKLNELRLEREFQIAQIKAVIYFTAFGILIICGVMVAVVTVGTIIFALLRLLG